jgi:hypothetical protein
LLAAPGGRFSLMPDSSQIHPDENVSGANVSAGNGS